MSKQCPTCHGDGSNLGTLGNDVYYRCRNCGAQWSTNQDWSRFARDNETDITLVVRLVRWMKSNCDAHVDNQTGEINYTTLAEEAADANDAYVDDTDYEIPEWVFDLAVLATE